MASKLVAETRKLLEEVSQNGNKVLQRTLRIDTVLGLVGVASRDRQWVYTVDSKVSHKRAKMRWVEQEYHREATN